MALPMGRRE
nr:orf; Method: conceptual translation supplied by author [Mus musculus]